MNIYNNPYPQYFYDNKYTNAYFFMIKRISKENRKKKRSNQPGYIYFEKHHIIPHSMGGPNRESNYILLTAYEHFIFHFLLIEMCISKQYRAKMINALHRLNNNLDHRSKKANINKKDISFLGTIFNHYRSEFGKNVGDRMRAIAPFRLPYTAEQRKKISERMSGELNPNYGTVYTKKYRAEISKRIERYHTTNPIRKKPVRKSRKGSKASFYPFGNKNCQRHYHVTLPNGQTLLVRSIDEFLLEHGITEQQFHKSLKNNISYEGFNFVRVEKTFTKEEQEQEKLRKLQIKNKRIEGKREERRLELEAKGIKQRVVLHNCDLVENKEIEIIQDIEHKLEEELILPPIYVPNIDLEKAKEIRKERKTRTTSNAAKKRGITPQCRQASIDKRKGKVWTKEQKENLKKKRKKQDYINVSRMIYKVILPNGQIEIIKDAKKFCEEHNLSRINFRKACFDKRFHKGYFIEKLGRT